MKQVNYYPEYYSKFRCSADKCPDSCCMLWEIVVDDVSAAIYDNISGETGDKLRNAMTEDQDGDIIFRLKGDRCPFLEDDMLCEIHRKLGEEYLCDTCREYPRAVQDFGNSAWHDLSLSCPKAAEIILSGKNEPLFYEKIAEIPDEELCFDSEFMSFMTEARRHLLDIIWDRSYTPGQAAEKCCEYAALIQQEIDGNSKPQIHFSITSLLKAYLAGDILTSDFSYALEQALSLGDSPETDDAKNALDNYDGLYRQLMTHYINRYWLRAVFDGKAFEKVMLMSQAYTAVRRLHYSYYAKNRELPFSAAVRIVQLFSKETEHNDEAVSLSSDDQM